MEENSPSEFYFACRNNDIQTVRRLLDEHPLENLDQMEPNGSTGLHAACFFKNIEIIQLLLDRGFTRRAVNRYKNTPFNESETDEIRELFKRPKTSNRFGGNVSYEQEKRIWFLIDGNEQHIVQYHASDTYDGNRLEYGLFNGEKILQKLGNMPKIDVIRRLFHRAIYEKDCTRLVQAYTAETEFYNRVNDYLLLQIQQIIIDGSAQTNSMSEFVDTIYLNHQLHENYRFEGKCYRCLKINSHNELNIYKVGAKMINRTFISTTKDRQFIEQYIRDIENKGQNTIIISFEIRHSKTALDIEYISEFSHEKEVLIMNNSVFKVISVINKPNLYVEIELRESKLTQGGILKIFGKK
jgi:hypothetical protein